MRKARGRHGPRFTPEDAWTSGPRHLNADGTALFMFDSRGRDTAALTRIDLASGATQVVAANPRVDLFDFILDADTLEPVAYSLDVERPEYVALTTEIQRDLDFLNGKELGDWHIGGRTEDERLWIINADSDLRPATTYLYDREQQTLRTLFEHRPELNGAPLVPMQPVVIRSRDGFELISYLTRPAGANQPGPLALTGSWRPVGTRRLRLQCRASMAGEPRL